MKMLKKFPFLMGIILILSACSAEAAQTPAADPSEDSVVKATTEAPGDSIEVTFWYPYGEGSDAGDFLAKQISIFNEANPDIQVNGQSYEDYASIIEGIQRGAAGNNLPSLAAIGFGYDDYIIESGIAQPIDTLMGADGESLLNDINPELLQVTTYDGHVYGIPLALSVAEVFYHPDLFEQAGLDPNVPPQTWDEFIAAANTLHEKTGVYGAAFALDDPWIFETAVRSNGAELLSNDGKSANLNSQTAIEILQDWGEGAESGAILYNADFMQTLQSFGAQQVAMFAVSSYGTGYYHENLPEVRAMPFPAGKGSVLNSPAGGNSVYLLGNNDAERQAATCFLTFLSSPDGNAAWAQASGYLPTRQSSLTSMQDYIDGFDNYQLAVSLIENVVSPTQWPSNHVLQIDQVIMDAIESVMLNQQSAADALNQANDKINVLLSQ